MLGINYLETIELVFWTMKNSLHRIEGGFFFPNTDSLRNDTKIYRGLDGRFFLSKSENGAVETTFGGPCKEFSVLQNVAYRQNR